MTSGTVIIKSVDMRDDMRQEAISCAMQALEAHDIEKDIAAFIKKHFDGRYEPTWHCIVGQSFGSFVTHESGYFIYLYIGQQAVLLFKAGIGIFEGLTYSPGHSGLCRREVAFSL